MNIGLNNIKLNEADCIMVPVLMDNDKIALESVSEVLSYIRNKEAFKGEHNEVFTTIQNNENGPQDLIFIGLGKEIELTSEKIRIALSKAIKKSRELKAKKLYVNFINSEKLCFGSIIKSMVEGLSFGEYKFDKYKSDKKEQINLDVYIGNVDNNCLEEAEEYINEANTLAEITLLARDLVNEPANVLYPESLATAVEDYGKKYGFQVEVFDELKIDELEMKAFLAVSQGADTSPRFIVMRHFGNPDNKSEILGLVGKGLTYDTGGYSLKSNEGMVTMKSDMGGAASVIGAISAIAKRKLKINVVAVVAACENILSATSYKPGDIIGSMAGKTIEVLNTDAEGRLTLIDAVHYVIAKENASKVIDVATLTGAVLSALGTTTTAAVTNNEEFYKELENASKKSDEKVWLLPAFDDYKKLIESDIADLKNVGGKLAGTITAALFIREFVQDKPWIHLDIAGTAWTDKETNYYSKGGTGVGVRTLYYLAKNKTKLY
jgi:leucyl aminopeptidase